MSRSDRPAGACRVDTLRGAASAQTASGDIAVAAAINGEISVQTGSGGADVGIAEGTAARLDLRTHTGRVSNTLRPAEGPASGDETLTVRVRTASGDVSVRRAKAAAV